MTIFDVPRSAWEAVPALVDPATRTGHRAHWNALRVGLTPADDHAKCIALVRSFYDYHVRDRRWLDVGYNLLICPHALVIEGRGVDAQGSHSTGSNVAEYGTQFMVGEGDEIPEAMFERFAQLHADLEAHSGHPLELNVHRDPPDASGTECPGDVIAARVHAMRPAAPEPPPVVVEPPPPTPPTPPPAPPKPVTTKDKIGELLRRGDEGAAVVYLQRRLLAYGHRLDDGADGKFGPETEQRVMDFQRAAGLHVDGVVGNSSWPALQEPTRAEMRAEVLRILEQHGWRVNSTARANQGVRDFQAAWAFGAELAVDGVVGPATYAAALELKRNGGKLSAHFSAAEFACRCGGRYADCRRIWVKRGLLTALETYRKRVGGPVRVVSGCRCPKHNASIKGAYHRSQHTTGRGCDVDPIFSIATVRALRVFSGIGFARSTRRVLHLDVRHLPGPDRDNYPYGSPGSPREFAEG